MNRLLQGSAVVVLAAVAGALGFAIAARAGAPAAAPPAIAATAKLIKVSAHRYEFVPNELTLKKGQPVDIELSTQDVLMGFNAPDFQTRANIMPGEVTHVRFTPMKAGTFSFLCDIFCGSGHEDMNGTITVVE